MAPPPRACNRPKMHCRRRCARGSRHVSPRARSKRTWLRNAAHCRRRCARGSRRVSQRARSKCPSCPRQRNAAPCRRHFAGALKRVVKHFEEITKAVDRNSAKTSLSEVLEITSCIKRPAALMADPKAWFLVRPSRGFLSQACFPFLACSRASGQASRFEGSQQLEQRWG